MVLFLLTVVLPTFDFQLLFQPAIAFGCVLQGFFCGELLVVGATGDDALRRAALSNDMYQSPTFHLICKYIVHQSQATFHLCKLVVLRFAYLKAHHRAIVISIELLFGGIQQESLKRSLVFGFKGGDECRSTIHFS